MTLPRSRFCEGAHEACPRGCCVLHGESFLLPRLYEGEEVSGSVLRLASCGKFAKSIGRSRNFLAFAFLVESFTAPRAVLFVVYFAVVVLLRLFIYIQH